MSLRQMQQRLLDAEIVLEDPVRRAATLSDYELRFSKKASTNPLIGFANIHVAPGHAVEGVLYELPPDAFAALDKAEGVAEGHYHRETLSVDCQELGFVEAQAYLAGEEWISEGLKPARNHLYRLLAGERFLSEAYFQKLKKTEALKVAVDDNGIPRNPADAPKDRPRYTPPPPKSPRAPKWVNLE